MEYSPTKILENMIVVVVEKPYVSGLFKNVHMQGAQKAEPQGVYRNTSSGAVCSLPRPSPG
jgi:hypothetical protein